MRGGGEAERERRRDVLVCLGYVLPYVAVFGLYDLTFERFALPLVPFLAVAAACALSALWSRIPERRRSVYAAATGAAAVLALPALGTWRLGSFRSQPDTFELAARWLEEHAVPAASACS